MEGRSLNAPPRAAEFCTGSVPTTQKFPDPKKFQPSFVRIKGRATFGPSDMRSTCSRAAVRDLR